MFRYSTRCSAFWKTFLSPLALLLALPLSCGTLQAAIPNQNNQLLQFSAADHVLGFRPNGLHAASGAHALNVGFVGTSGVIPTAEGDGGNDSRTHSLTRVTYSDLWPGISLYYGATTKGIAASTWEVAAGGDAKQIQLRYNAPVSIDDNGNLRITYETGWMRESAPVAWQEINGRRRPVDVAFRLFESPEAEPLVGFEVGSYDPAHPLVIDPVLAWHTFLGSSDYDYGRAIAVDSSGNVYVVGNSYANWGKPATPHAGDTDAFVAKLDANGTLLWNTFMGSSSDDYGYAIALDGGGNVFVAGYSYTSWGTPVNAHAGNYDAFVTKLNADGQRLWHTFLGTSDYDVGFALAVDSSSVYVAGDSNASWGTPVNAHSGGVDAFTAKLDANGALLWTTYMGSSGTDSSRAIAIDDSSNLYVTGYSSAAWGAPENAFVGGVDAFVTKLNAKGVRLWHTFMGSTDGDYGYAVTVDDKGNIYLAGESNSSWGITPVNAHAGGIDAFTAKLNTKGEQLWNTFMGSSDYDSGLAIAMDDSGDIYVAGKSSATWGDSEIPHAVDDYDAFTTKLNARGNRLWNTFLGAAISDSGVAISVDSAGIYLTGTSETSWGTPIKLYLGFLSAFATRLNDAQNRVSCRDRC